MNSNSIESTNLYAENLAQHVTLESVPMLVLTWNVNGHVENNLQSLKDQLLFPKPKGFDGSETTEDYFFGLQPQMIIIGFQELIELSTTNVIGNAVNSQDTIDKLNAWEENILNVLLDVHDEFEVLEKHSMVGLGLIVFCWRGLKNIIENVQIAELPRGVGGVLGNKGAIYLRMEIYDSSICIVNSHFAAHREKLKKRNQDYYAILNHPAFPDLAYSKFQQVTQNFIPPVKAVQAKGLLSSVKKKLQNYYNTYGHEHVVPDNILPASGVTSGIHSEATSAITSVNLTHPNSQRYSSSQLSRSRLSSHSSLKSANSRTSSKYYVVEDNTEEFDNRNSLPNSSGPTLAPTPLVSTLPEIDSLGTFFPALKADDHDIIIWIGDLNYRIVSTVDMDTVYEHIENDDLMTLLSYDQLNQEKEKNNIFQGFNEGLLTFPPTYQYIPGKDIYDNRKDSKRRCPAWCDRILWRIGKHNTHNLILQELETRQRQQFMRAQRRGSQLRKHSSHNILQEDSNPSTPNTPNTSGKEPGGLMGALKTMTKTLSGKGLDDGFECRDRLHGVGGDDSDASSENSSTHGEERKWKEGIAEKDLLTLSNSSLDEIVTKSKSQDSAGQIKHGKTDLSTMIIPEADEEEEEDDGDDVNELEDGLAEGDEDMEDDDFDEDEEDEEGGNEEGNYHSNRRRRLSVKEINQIQKIAEQLLKKKPIVPRGSITGPLPKQGRKSLLLNTNLDSPILVNPPPTREHSSSFIGLSDVISTPPALSPIQKSPSMDANHEPFSDSHSPKSKDHSIDEGNRQSTSNTGLASPAREHRNITSVRSTDRISERFRASSAVSSTETEASTVARERISRAMEEYENSQNPNQQQTENDEEDEDLNDDNYNLDSNRNSTNRYFRKHEMVELLTYDRCPHTLSDHKAVRAFLNLKVKR